jgi:hypothetical protein
MVSPFTALKSADGDWISICRALEDVSCPKAEDAKLHARTDVKTTILFRIGSPIDDCEPKRDRRKMTRPDP